MKLRGDIVQPAGSQETKVSHEVLGVSLLLLTRVGGPDRLADATRILAQGQALDPTFLPLLKNRLLAAQMRGDAAAAKSLALEYQRVLAVARGQDR